MRNLMAGLVLALVLTGIFTRWGVAQQDKKETAVQTEPAARTCAFVALRDFASWEKTSETDTETVLTSSEITLPMQANEIVVSWNAEAPADTGLEVEARAVLADRTTKWYSLGRWSRDDGRFP